MESSREALLRPTLSQDSSIATPLSVQATAITAFFGAPLAALAITTINSYRLRRLLRDLPLLLLLLLVAIAAAWLTDAPRAIPEAFAGWLNANLGSAGPRIVHRFFALCIVGVGYGLHRREQRNAEVMGFARPNGWLVGIPCVLLGSIAWGFLIVGMRNW